MFETLKQCLVYVVPTALCLLSAYRFFLLPPRIHIMTNERIKTFTTVINKETFRENKTLFQRIILQRATQDIVTALVTKKNDKQFATFIIQNTRTATIANKVARHIICNYPSRNYTRNKLSTNILEINTHLNSNGFN